MCGPLAIPVALAVAGGGLQALGKINEGRAERQASKTSQKIAERDEIVAGIATGQKQAEITRRQRIAEGRAVVAAAGGGRRFSGSVLDAVTGNNLLAEQDILAAQFGARVNQAAARTERNIAKASRKGLGARTAIGVGSTILTTASTISKMGAF